MIAVDFMARLVMLPELAVVRESLITNITGGLMVHCDVVFQLTLATKDKGAVLAADAMVTLHMIAKESCGCEDFITLIARKGVTCGHVDH